MTRPSQPGTMKRASSSSVSAFWVGSSFDIETWWRSPDDLRSRLTALRHWRQSWWPSIATRKWWVSLLSYFSVWNLMTMMACIMLHPMHDRITLPYRVFLLMRTNMVICSVGGGYLAWYSPRTIHIPYLHLYLRSSGYRLVDLVAHQAPLLWFCCRVRYSTRDVTTVYTDWLLSHLMIAIYGGAFGSTILSRYQMTKSDLLWIAFLSAMGTTIAWCRDPIETDL